MFEFSNYIWCLFQLIDALVSLFGRSNISAETLWDGGWLLHQLLPYIDSEFNNDHLELLQVRIYEAFPPTQNLMHAPIIAYCLQIYQRPHVCFVG